jgi:hypothetical protein
LSFNKGNVFEWRLAKNNFEALNSNNEGIIKLRDDNTNKMRAKELKIKKRSSDNLVSLPPRSISLKPNTFDNVLYNNEKEMLKLSKRQSLITYTVKYVDKPELQEGISQNYLNLPAGISDRYNELAKNIKKDSSKPEDIVTNLTNYFRENKFKYSLSVNVSRKYDPVYHFLTESKKGYCEYYATASVILLRLMGVKSRYVGGYTVPEQGEMGDYCVIRQLHSHAWVEYYDDILKCWRTYDPTLFADGVQLFEEYKPSKFNLFIENSFFKFEEFTAYIKSISFKDIQNLIQKVIKNWIVNLLLLIIVIVYVVLRLALSKEKIIFKKVKKEKAKKLFLSKEQRDWYDLINLLENIITRYATPREKSITLKEYIIQLNKVQLSSKLGELAKVIIDKFYLFRFRGEHIPVEETEKYRQKLLFFEKQKK